MLNVDITKQELTIQQEFDLKLISKKYLVSKLKVTDPLKNKLHSMVMINLYAAQLIRDISKFWGREEI